MTDQEFKAFCQAKMREINDSHEKWKNTNEGKNFSKHIKKGFDTKYKLNKTA